MAIDLLEQIYPHIKNSIYPIRIQIPDWKMKEGDVPQAASISFNDRSWTSIRIPFLWGKFDKTFWFRQTIKVDQTLAGKPLVLLVDFPQALLYLNGKPFHGIDCNHREILLCEKSKLNDQYFIAIQAYSGRTQNHHIFSSVELAVLDTTARRFYSALNVLQDLEKLVEHNSLESKEIRDLIRRTLIFLKYFKPGSEEYPNAIRRAYNFLLNTLETDLKTSLSGLVHLIGHSYIAPAWLSIIHETARQCGRTISSALRLMEEFPEFKFSFGLPNLYELTKNNYPELFRQIKSRVAEGKWEVLGSTWTDTDCNITNGESLIRQILFGKKFIKNEFGIENDTLWLPNSFGFHWAMPQILIKSGVTKFYTSKLSSNDSTKFPYSSFWWQGIDGSKVLAHISPVGLEGQVIPESLNKNISSNVDDQTFPVLQTFGFGNNGGGVTKDNMEFAIILKSIIGLPPSQHSTVKEFFSQLKEHEDILPTWNNELYLEAHRGSYTTNSTIKKSNRASETLLYNAELLSTLLQVFGKNMKSRKYPQETLEYIWKMFLMNQSQNVLSGTSIAVVNSEADQRFQQINNGCANIITNCIGKLSSPVKKKKNEYQFTLFNTQAWSRNEYVELSFKSNEKHFIVCDEQEKAIEFQIIERSKNIQKLLCFVNDIPAFSFKRIIIRSVPKSLTTPISWNASSHGIETPFYKIRLDGKGSISSLFAKNLRRELIQKGKRGNLFILYRDAPKEYEAWNLDDEYEKHRLDVLQIKQIRILEQGPIRATIRLEFRTEHGSTLVQNMYLYHQSPRIDFSTNIRWHEKQTLLKVAFQFNLKSPSTSYEIPFGAINRTSKPHSDWEKAKYEVPALQWADMSDTKYGISLINDSKYGHDANENILRLTLLRSPHYPNPIAPNESDNTWIDQGDHSITYALYPHHGSWTKEETIRRSRELNNPILIFPNIIAESYPILIEGLKSNIIIDSIKKAEQNESMIIRLHEAHGIVTDTSPRLNFAAQAIFECDLLENDLKSCKFNKSKLALKFKPFEIKTLRIVLKQSRKSPK